MKFFATIVAIACAVLVSAQQPVVTNCATGPTDITITSFTLNPYPLCINQNVCATGTGTLIHPVIQGATLDISGKYLGRVVYTDAHDLCVLMGSQGHPCPIPTTLTSITACVLVKPSAPANIPVQLKVLATNGDGHVLFCQAATVTASNCPV